MIWLLKLSLPLVGGGEEGVSASVKHLSLCFVQVEWLFTR